jgi:hypothetical protein
MSSEQQGNVSGLQVYRAIAAVTSKLTKAGIGKDRQNTQQGYSFRGIDDVYNALAPLLAAEQLCILPRVKSREVIERQTQRGGTLFYVSVDVDFHFVSAVDGSQHVVSMPGEAMDSGDKATNKAMSAAYKYACLQTFCIPTEGDNDADAMTHTDVTPTAKPVKKQATVQSPAAGEPVLGPSEIDSINALARATGVPVEKIAAKYGVKTVEQIPLSKTAEIVDRLQKLALKEAA